MSVIQPLSSVFSRRAADALYLFTLDMPEYGEAGLHVIPAAELREAGFEDPPLWRPHLGSAPPDRS